MRQPTRNKDLVPSANVCDIVTSVIIYGRRAYITEVRSQIFSPDHAGELLDCHPFIRVFTCSTMGTGLIKDVQSCIVNMLTYRIKDRLRPLSGESEHLSLLGS